MRGTKEYCIRCTHIFKGEERYFLLGAYYCHPCIEEIQNDPDYLNKVRELASMIQIEN